MTELLSMSTKRLFLFVAILTLVVLAILVGLFLFKLEHFGDSDTWWYGALFKLEYYANSDVWVYGAITGFFGWLFLALLIATALLYYKIKREAKILPS